MAIITAGYDGTVDEVQFAEILHRYSVVGSEDFKASTQAGDRIVAISDGVALGPGTRDVATAIPTIQFAAAATGATRWDLVVLRRDWQPPGGSSSIVIVQGGTSKGYPAVGTATTNWNRRPGIVDDQPLYLQEVNGTLLGARVDLRVWAGQGGLYAKDDLVKTYLDRVGTEVNINGVHWLYRLGDNDIPGWVKTNPARINILGGAGVPWFVFGEVQVTINTYGVGFITFPEAFPTALRYLDVTDCTTTPGSGIENKGVVCKPLMGQSTKSQAQFIPYTTDGATLAGKTLYVTYVAGGN